MSIYKMQNILITGFPGQDSKILAYLLLKNGYNICLLSKEHNEAVKSEIDLLKKIFPKRKILLIASIEKDKNALQSLLYEFEPAYVFHFAALSSPKICSKKPMSALDSNCKTTLTLLNAINNWRKETPTIIASSIYLKQILRGIYRVPIHELTQTTQSTGVYETTKRIVADLVSLYRQNGMNRISLLYLSNHESPFRGNDYAIPSILEIVRDAKTGIIKRPYVIRDWSLATDTICNILAVTCEGLGEDFVVGSGSSHSVAEVANFICKLNNSPLLFQNTEDLEETDRIYLNIKKLQELKGVVPKSHNSYKEMIEVMFKYWPTKEHDNSYNWINECEMISTINLNISRLNDFY